MEHNEAEVVTGAAERALLTRHRTLLDDVEAVIGRRRPLSPSASAFRLACDPAVGRDVLDTSAVAASMGVLLTAVDEQTLSVPLLDLTADAAAATAGTRSPGPGRSTAPVVTTRTPTPAAAVHQAVGTLTTVLTRAEAILSVPSRAAGRERGELACGAYARGWYEEAEKLFLDAAERLPTEPYLWFGAGLAAARLSADRAVAHLLRAARYLQVTDRGAAAYVHIVAAALREQERDRPAARALLASALDQLGEPCAAISLHLARLADDPAPHLRRALETDPLLEADLLALGLEGTSTALVERRRQSADELGWLEYSMAELRRVDGGPRFPEPAETPEPEPGTGALPLARLEVQLWSKLRRCEEQIRQARHIVSIRQEARQDKEHEISAATELAKGDLDYQTAVPVLIAAVMVAAGLLASFVVAGPASTWAPVPPWLVGAWLFVGRIGMVVFFVWLVAFLTWPRRHFRRARRAREELLPRLEWQASQLRRSEFEARRRFSNANQAAELGIRRIVDRRRQLLPRRPSFPVGADLGPPSRAQR